jgi:hypothetical protein
MWGGGFDAMAGSPGETDRIATVAGSRTIVFGELENRKAGDWYRPAVVVVVEVAALAAWVALGTMMPGPTLRHTALALPAVKTCLPFISRSRSDLHAQSPARRLSTRSEV